MKNATLVWIVVLGLVIRLIAAGLLFHTDGKAIYRDAISTNEGIAQAYKVQSSVGNPLPYPPMVYELFNGYRKFFGYLFTPYFSTWMNDWSTLQTANHPHIYRDLLAMKLPMIAADVFCGWIIWLLTKKDRRILALSIWFFNPISIYAIYGTGQFDIIPTALVLLGAFFWERKRTWLTYTLLGIAGGLKLFPLLLIPLVFFLDRSSWHKKILGLGLAAMSLSAMFIPVKFSTEIIKQIFTSNLAESMFRAGIDLGNGAFLPLALLAYSIVTLGILISPRPIGFIESTTSILLIILGLSRFHAQWIIWALPFLVILLAEAKVESRIGTWIGISYLGAQMLINDKFTNFGQLKAINNAFDTLFPLRYYVDKLGVGSQAYGLAVAAFLAGAIVYSVKVFSSKHNTFDVKAQSMWQRPGKLFAVWVAMATAIFLLAHIPLTLWGKYLDHETSSQNVVTALSASTVITQEINVVNDNFSAIQFLIKNVNLRTRVDLLWKLHKKDSGAVVREGVVNGVAIGDDFDLTLTFQRIPDSAGNTYVLEFLAPETIADNEFVVPYDDRSANGGMTIDGLPKGSLAYRTFFNPGGYIQNVSFSVVNIFKKI